MIQKTALLIFVILLLVTACTINEVGPPGIDGVNDKQIRLPFGANTQTSAGNDSIRLGTQYDLIKFDKRNYVTVDSVIFVSRMRSAIDSDTCVVQLYNATDRRIITKATLVSDTTVFLWKESKNIYTDLPDKEISLGVIVRNKKSGTVVEGGQSYLFLYRE
jgi:hypothetical protein